MRAVVVRRLHIDLEQVIPRLCRACLVVSSRQVALRRTLRTTVTLRGLHGVAIFGNNHVSLVGTDLTQASGGRQDHRNTTVNLHSTP